MNKKLSAVLWALLGLAAIAFICLTAWQIVMAFLCKDYLRAVIFLAIDILCVELAGTAIARLFRLGQKKGKYTRKKS